MTCDTSASINFITIPELAAQWRCTEQHLYKLIKRGALPAVRIGRRVIVHKDAAQRYLERNSTVPVAA